MNTDVAVGFADLKHEIRALSATLKEKGLASTERLDYWPNFISTYAVAKNVISDVLRKQKLDTAMIYLNGSKSELNAYVSEEQFVQIEQILQSLIEKIAQTLESPNASPRV